MTSRAAVFHGAGEPLLLEEFPIPELNAGEALVRIRCATICGSDLHSYFGRRPSPAPCVIGHEMVGEIAGIGSGGVFDYRGRPLVLGERVTWSMVWSCGECFYCTHELRPKCEHLMKFGHERISPARALTGGMAEYSHLPPHTAIFKVPSELPDCVATPANCATATVAAVFRNAGSVVGAAVVIHGAGMLGLTACAMAAFGGARHILAIEPDERRRDQALRFGATAAVDSALPPDQILQIVKGASDGRGADIGLELAGFPESIELGVRLLRTGGRFVLAGSTFPGRPVRLPAQDLVRRMIRIEGVYNYSPEDLESALAFLSRVVNLHSFESLVGKSFHLSEANAAMHFAENDRPPRVALIP
jgi:putative phosphonate catabolism associated alcohol dehydrogenase